MATISLRSPLFTDWAPQYIKLELPDVEPGAPLTLAVDGESHAFQYTGDVGENGAVVMLKLGFARDQSRALEFAEAGASDTEFTHDRIDLARGAEIGFGDQRIRIAAPQVTGDRVAGPFAEVAGYPTTSSIGCETAFESAELTRTNRGPLFEDYTLIYRFDQRREYTLQFRCYREDPMVEVSERFSLAMHGNLQWTLNPEKRFDRILSHRGPEFEGEPQPKIDQLGQERPGDVLCRMQMPVLNEYFIPNNRGWFAFFSSTRENDGMLGFLGLYGRRWMQPVENKPELLERGGTVQWNASLESGARYWLLYRGPVEKEYTEDRRFVFHRLHAQFNALRLDEHLDLTGEAVYDASSHDRPGIFEQGDFRAGIPRRIDAIPALKKTVEQLDLDPGERNPAHWNIFTALVKPSDETHEALYDGLIARFVKWVRQFQGYRRGQGDYSKNVIGFTRNLRGLMIGYELLRRDGWLDDEQLGKLNAYFIFAARRIMDEGRWPHSRTWRHPDHPESIRDMYRYGGEHRPDRLVWTNSLPNFQSDPLCALAHLSALFTDHPDTGKWRRKAIDDIERQLTAYCGKSGAWEESINYALYTFSYLVITMRALKHRAGVDYFNDERVRRYADWLCRFFGPYDKRFEAYTWPAIGNSVLPQPGGEFLLAYAAELEENDPLRDHCLAVYQKQEELVRLREHYPTVLAAMAPVPDRQYELPDCHSEHMDEVGVAMRHEHKTDRESYLFQKIGFAKDHYEGDESAFNWYAKGTPLTMDYGTYTGDIGKPSAHNLVEIPDEDNIRRGYLARHLFSPVVDFTHCEMPVTLKLLWGRMRSFDEIDGKHAQVDRMDTPYHYIGDENPVGPKTWKVRLLMFIKPDYVAIFDRVYGDVPHRWNIHVTADGIETPMPRITATGRFDLDLLAFVQHPARHEVETGFITPNMRNRARADDAALHSQSFARVYNREDGIYRTALFAKERDREVTLETAGEHGIKVVTPEYTDYVFLHDDVVRVQCDEFGFVGRAGWIRRGAGGAVQACLADGDEIAAFGRRMTGMGPWTYNVDQPDTVVIKDGPPRVISVTEESA